MMMQWISQLHYHAIGDKNGNVVKNSQKGKEETKWKEQ